MTVWNCRVSFSTISDLTRQIAVVDGYLSKKKTRLSAPVLVKTIPETTVACMRIRLDSYDCLFDRMPEMGALMEKAGCECVDCIPLNGQ